MNELEKLLGVFFVAKYECKKDFLDNETIPTIIYLLKKQKISFSYIIQYLGIPISPELDDDLRNLEMAGYLISNLEMLGISEKGVDLIKSISELEDFSKKIITQLKMILSWEKKQIFKAFYTMNET